MENLYTVYEHINKTNNKKYIGITSHKNPSDRWGSNGVNYKANKHFYSAIQKYGWDNFEHIILFTGLSQEDASMKEKELIQQYNSTDPEFGYNISCGGDGHYFNHSESTKKKISKSISGENNPNWNGKTNTPEHMEKLRLANVGSKHTEEHKKKIGDSLRGQHYHDDEFKKRLSERKSKKIIREDGVVYNSFTEAAKANGVSQSSISTAVKYNIKRAGYYWKCA